MDLKLKQRHFLSHINSFVNKHKILYTTLLNTTITYRFLHILYYQKTLIFVLKLNFFKLHCLNFRAKNERYLWILHPIKVSNNWIFLFKILDFDPKLIFKKLQKLFLTRFLLQKFKIFKVFLNKKSLFRTVWCRNKFQKEIYFE